ncbi:M28 family peptidase, partial [bacterium]|nr:M28 family peptidase [bacterium]
MRDRIERLVAALCSDECAGRAPGTRGGLLAREHVREALVAAGLRAEDQPIRGVNGANLICELEGSGPLADRAVVIGAHYDHLGSGPSGEIYRGADDNAAAVAVLVEAGRILASERGPRRRIVVAAFDTEEPPHFLEGTMGSEVLAASGRLALDRVDLVVAMDLVGHAVGQDGFPSAVRESIFVLGAEKSAGTAALVDGAARGIAGLRARR